MLVWIFSAPYFSLLGKVRNSHPEERIPLGMTLEIKGGKSGAFL